MSIIDSAREFLGFGPYENDGYFDDEYDNDVDDRARSERREAVPARGERYSSARAADYAAPAERSAHSAHSVAASRTEPKIVVPMLHSYRDAKKVGEPFRDGDIVIMDLTGLSKLDAKAYIDFASGLCLALFGQMHNLSRGLDVDRRVFAITPQGVNVSMDELLREAHLD